MNEDPVDVLVRLHGRARTGEVLRFTTRHRLEGAVLAGRVRRADRGVLVLPELPDADVAAARAGGVLSHASAAHRWNLRLVKTPDVVHVTVPHGARPAPQPGVRVHWSVAGVDLAERSTPLVRTVLDCATTMPFDEALSVADSAIARGFVKRDVLVTAAAQTSRTGRRRRLRVVSAADGRAASAFESRLRGLVLAAGLTGFVPQFEIRVRSRTVRVDLADPVRRIVLEADSFEHHGSREALVRDATRQDELVADGWRVLRFTWEDVMFEPAWVVSMVQEVCRPRTPAILYVPEPPSVVVTQPAR